MKWAFYDGVSGKIRCIAWCYASEVRLSLLEGEMSIAVLADELGETHYVDVATHQLTPKASLPAFDKTEFKADGSDCAKMLGLPNPTKAYIRSTVQSDTTVEDVEDGEVTIDSLQPATFTVRLVPPVQYREVEVTLNAV